MALYKSPKQMIADKRLPEATRTALEREYMPKVEHKSQLIADMNFVRTVAKKKASFYWDVNTMVSHRAPDLSDSLVAATLSDAQLKHKDAVEHVRKLTDKINTVTKELNAVVKEMYGCYTYQLKAVAENAKIAKAAKAKIQKARKQAKQVIPMKPTLRQNTIHMNRHELLTFVNGLCKALREHPAEQDFNINLITAVRGN